MPTPNSSLPSSPAAERNKDYILEVLRGTLPIRGRILEIASGNVQVPNLIGKSEIEAKTILTQAGFLVKTVTAFDSNQPLGVVLAQAPSAGETKIIGSSVTITINSNS